MLQNREFFRRHRWHGRTRSIVPVVRLGAVVSHGGLPFPSFKYILTRCRRNLKGSPMAKHAPGFLKLVQDAKTRVRECTVADVKKRLDGHDRFTLVDVREESEFAAGHLPGAVHIGKGVIEPDIEAKVPDPPLPLPLYRGRGV